MFGCGHMARTWFLEVRAEELVSDANVDACRNVQLRESTDEGLVLGNELSTRRDGIYGNAVDDESGAVRRGSWSAIRESMAIEEFMHESFL